MDTRYIREFLTFAAELNYSTAAKKLFITRPTLTEHIHELENELGCPLVTKAQGKALLTPAGRLFVKTGAGLLETVDDVIEEYQGLADNLLTITVAQTNLPWLETILYRARQAVQKRYPAKRIDIETANGPFSTIEALVSGANDIVVVGCKSYIPEKKRGLLHEGVQGFKLGTEDIKLFMTQDNALFGSEGISARDMDGATLMLPPDIYHAYVRDDVAGYFLEHGAHITLQTMDFSDHFQYYVYDFQGAFGVVPTTLMSRFGIEERKECRAFSLVDLVLRSDFYVLYTKEFAESENGMLLIEEMKLLAQATGLPHTPMNNGTF